MNIFDYTAHGRRPSARQIVADWKKAGRPLVFQVEYGETYAHFGQVSTVWFGTGNGCGGFKRDTVVRLLNDARDTAVRAAKRQETSTQTERLLRAVVVRDVALMSLRRKCATYVAKLRACEDTIRGLREELAHIRPQLKDCIAAQRLQQPGDKSELYLGGGEDYTGER